MSLTIHKYEIPLTDRAEILLPGFWRVLSVGVQRGKPMLWAMVQPGGKRTPLRLAICGTGDDAEGLGQFIGTLILEDGELVLHVFEGG